MNSFFTRNIIESALRFVGAFVPSPQQTEFAPSTSTPIDYFDTTSMLKEPTKYYPGERVPAPLLVVHVTDITGGFGVSPKRVAYWAGELEKLLDQDAERAKTGRTFNYTKVFDQLPKPATSPQWIVDNANRLALWERFGRTPYHWVAAHNGDVLRNHPATRRTKHGNAGNRGIGVAIDVGHKEAIDAFVIETGRAALRCALEDRVDVEAWPGEVLVQPHRCFSPQRRVDTDAFVWREIVLPVVAATPWARVDYELAENGGRPVPRSWDENALFDDKGRRLRR